MNKSLSQFPGHPEPEVDVVSWGIDWFVKKPIAKNH